MSSRAATVLTGLTVLLGVGLLGLAGTCAYQAIAGATATRDLAAQRHRLQTTERQMALRTRAHLESRPLQARIPVQPAAWTWSEQLPLILAQLARVIEGSGVQMETMQPAPVVAREGIARFPLRVTLRTDLPRLTQLLGRLRTTQPILTVDVLTIHTGQTADDPLQVDLTLSSYVRLSPAPAGGRP